MKLSPSILKNPKGAFFTTYGIENGEVYIKNSFLGIKYGNEPSVPVSKVTRTYATGTIFGSIVFGEGSHEPVIWENVFRPESELKLVRETINKELENSNNPMTDLLNEARKNRISNFGNTSQYSVNSAIIKDIETPSGIFKIDGDGTVTNQDNNLMWMQAPWRMIWNGSEFSGKPILINWVEGTDLFGKGSLVKGKGGDLARIPDEDIPKTSIRHGFEQGSCIVQHAEHSDWRLPTVEELNTLMFNSESLDVKLGLYSSVRNEMLMSIFLEINRNGSGYEVCLRAYWTCNCKAQPNM